MTNEQREDFKLRYKAISDLMPRNFVPVMEFFFEEKYSKDQLRDFKNGKTMNFDLLSDFEKLIETKKGLDS
jgi:hypothetical protein